MLELELRCQAISKYERSTARLCDVTFWLSIIFMDKIVREAQEEIYGDSSIQCEFGAVCKCCDDARGEMWGCGRNLNYPEFLCLHNTLVAYYWTLHQNKISTKKTELLTREDEETLWQSHVLNQTLHMGCPQVCIYFFSAVEFLPPPDTEFHCLQKVCDSYFRKLHAMGI